MELSELYLAQDLHMQAAFCLEEVLLIAPNAWNIHARLAEVIYIATTSAAAENEPRLLRGLSESLRRYCRSVELCDDYLRGYYGIHLTSRRLVDLLEKGTQPTSPAPELPFGHADVAELPMARQLLELSTKKLTEILRKKIGYRQDEMAAARELLQGTVTR